MHIRMLQVVTCFASCIATSPPSVVQLQASRVSDALIGNASKVAVAAAELGHAVGDLAVAVGDAAVPPELLPRLMPPRRKSRWSRWLHRQREKADAMSLGASFHTAISMSLGVCAVSVLLQTIESSSSMSPNVQEALKAWAALRLQHQLLLTTACAFCMYAASDSLSQVLTQHWQSAQKKSVYRIDPSRMLRSGAISSLLSGFLAVFYFTYALWPPSWCPVCRGHPMKITLLTRLVLCASQAAREGFPGSSSLAGRMGSLGNMDIARPVGVACACVVQGLHRCWVLRACVRCALHYAAGAAARRALQANGSEDDSLGDIKGAAHLGDESEILGPGRFCQLCICRPSAPAAVQCMLLDPLVNLPLFDGKR